MNCLKCLIQPIVNAFLRPAKEETKSKGKDGVEAQHSGPETPTQPIIKDNETTSPRPIEAPLRTPHISICTAIEPIPPRNDNIAPLTPNGLTPSHSSRRNSESSHRSHDGDTSQVSRSRSNSRSNSKNSAAGDSLKEMLRGARKECPRGSHNFLVPKCDQVSLITVDAVARDLQARNHAIDGTEAAEWAEKICLCARSLFAILVYMKKGAEICPLLKEGVSDKDLPLRRRPDGQGPFALQRKSGKSIKTFEEWSDHELEKFDRIQRWMTAPVFEDKEHYELDDNTVLPFVPFEPNAETLGPKQGGYSEVYPVRVHPAHHNFWKPSQSEDDEPFVAIKKLHSTDERDFLKEVDILKALGSRPKKHPHLIELLATFQHKEKYHLMFPYADANLRKYWEDRPQNNFDKATILWSLKQMTGIANALLWVHNFKVTYPLSVDGPGQVRVQRDATLRVRKGAEKYGRHGDIKPENILWFKKIREIEDDMGVLQLADFGLGRFHGRESRSRVNPDTVLASPTYEPPECKLRRPVSRAYDIWSLGCVYLEFITWLLKGFADIEGFSDFRGALNSNNINDDNFFTITRNPNTRPEAVVREQVIVWVNQLHEHEKCSALIHNLLDLIMRDLLVVDSKKRVEASGLYQELKKYLKRAEEDEEYLLAPVPRPRDSHTGARSKSLFTPYRRLGWIWFFRTREPPVS